MSAPRNQFRSSAPKRPNRQVPRGQAAKGNTAHGQSHSERTGGNRQSPVGKDPHTGGPKRYSTPSQSAQTDAPRAPRQERRERNERFDRGESRPARSERGEDQRRPHRGAASGQAPRGDARSKDFGGRGTRSRGSQSPQTADLALPERFRGTVVDSEAPVTVSFAQLGVPAAMVQVLEQSGAHTPFAIQAATIPVGLAGRDLLVRSHTGSGKTIAFGVSLVHQVWKSGSGKGRREYARAPKALIVAPTRELALQIDRVVQPLAQAMGLFTTQVYGGVPQGKQVGALRRGVDIVIGTPGRLEDLIKQRHLDLSQVIVSTIDEADHMAELGFIEPVRRLLSQTAEGGQRFLFSATLDRQVTSLVEQFLSEPAIFELADHRMDSSSVDHQVYVIDPRDKDAIVIDLVGRGGKTLVFTRTRRAAEGFRDALREQGIKAVDLHGDLNQNRRQRNLAELTSGRVNVLVATDVAARGIHVDDVDLVIQADPPEESKAYVHRAGRTGRAGKTGQVITLTTSRGEARMGDILRQAGVQWESRRMRPNARP